LLRQWKLRTKTKELKMNSDYVRFKNSEVEIFKMSWETRENGKYLDDVKCKLPVSEVAGWYWHTRESGCIPDDFAVGPFKTKKAATHDAAEKLETIEIR